MSHSSGCTSLSSGIVFLGGSYGGGHSPPSSGAPIIPSGVSGIGLCTRTGSGEGRGDILPVPSSLKVFLSCGGLSSNIMDSCSREMCREVGGRLASWALLGVSSEGLGLDRFNGVRTTGISRPRGFRGNSSGLAVKTGKGHNRNGLKTLRCNSLQKGCIC